MATAEPRLESPRRSGILVWGVIVVLTLLFGGLTAYRILSRDLNEVNEGRLRELRDAVARPDEQRPTGPDWPQWRGPNRDGVSTETGLLTPWPEDGPKVLWNKPTGDGYSSMAVARGRVFTMVQDGEDEAVVCWDAETGAERWRFKYPCHFRQPYGDGPRSTPAIAGDSIYTVSGTGIVHCLKAFTDRPTGEMVWRTDLVEEKGDSELQWGVSFSPLVENGLVHVMPGGPTRSALAALDKDTGKFVWKKFTDRPSYSSPMPADLAGRHQIVWLTGERLVGVVPETGDLLWEVPWDAGLGHAPTNIATPLVIHLDIGDYVFVSSGYARGCGLFKIEKQGDAFKASKVYHNLNMGTIFSTCVRQGEYLFGFDDTQLKCLQLSTGTATWRKAGFGKGSVTLVDGHLIILGDSGKLALATADPQRYREVSRFEHSDQPSSWSVPVFAGGRLYVRDKKQLVCYDVKKSP
jgi:outer membrane protein assembly factor BamB